MVTNSRKNRRKSGQSRPVQDKATNEEDQMETVELSRIPPDKLNYLNINHIFLELHKSKRKYELVCNACGISMTTVGAAIHHTSMTYHNVNVTTVELKHTLFYLPPITESHRVALNASLKSSTASVIADRNEIQRRQNFANDLIAAIEARIPNIRVRGTGSVWFNLALPDVEVSLDAVRVDDTNEPFSPTKESVIDYENAGPLSPLSDSSQLSDEEKRAKANSLGLGYVLSHIFELLQCNACEQPTSEFEDTTMSEENIHNSVASSDKTEANQMSELPKFPKFQTVLRTNTDTFYLSLTDLHGVAYHIGTGHPNGYDLAKLIDTYLKLNDKALQLSILFRKLARLAHLDMPENGTFDEPIIPMLVIFYLQHCDPSILPNLHNLYRQHIDNIPQDSYHQVLLPDGDCSFITDIELIRSLCPDKPSTDSSCESPSLADLWLGFLRFYLFDFKMSSCAIDIMRSQPVTKSGGAKRYFTVIDPFKKNRNLCSNVTAVSLDYINSQLLAAYGYFGVPRLAKNGRHVFTKISVAKEINLVNEEDKGDGDNENEHQATKTNTEQNENTTTTINSAKTTPEKGTKVKIVHIIPIFDDSDGFVKNLNKVTNLISEKFHSLSIARNNIDAFESLGSEDLVNSLNDQNNKLKTLPLSQMLPHFLYCVMDELFESVDVPGLVAACSNLPQSKFFLPLTGSDEMTLSDFNWIARNYAYRFWLKHFNLYVSKGIYTVQKRKVVRCSTFLFRMSLKSWLSTLDPLKKTVNSTNDDANIQEGNGAALQKTEESDEKKCERSYSPLTVQTKDDQISDSQIINKKNIITDKISQENDNKRVEGGKKEEGKENSSRSENFNSPNSYTFSDEDDDQELDETDEIDKLSMDVNDGDEYVTPDEKVFLDDNCFINNDEMNEELERTLELGDDDELNESSIDPCTTLSSFIDKSSDGIHCSIVHESRTTGNDETEPDNINLTSVNSEQASDSNLCSTPNKSVTVASDKIAEDTSTTVMAPPSKLSRKEGKEGNVSTATTNTNMKEKNSVKAKKKGKILQWNDVILSRIAVSQPVDDERPDYYNSELLKDLQPEDFDFTFAARSHFPSRGHRTLSSVLGLASRNHPSTLLAHFDAPQPQCQACGVTGHRWTQCQTSNDKSVSFLAWRKLSNKTAWPPKPEQIKDLTSCLERLEKYHEAEEKIHARKVFVQKIQQAFAIRFPSVQLELFGSCANGFDLQSSDLDVCVFFPTKSPEWLAMQNEETTVEMIKKFRNQLFRCSNRLQLVQVQPVLKARVPILKVSFRNSFEVDISFSNYLALSNTRMLAFYCELQPKLRILGIALKTVTKITKIGKAAAGGISSYACIIMIIHYLQQIGQLPVLQELYEGQSKPVTLVNGWDVWYQNDLSVINRLWKPTNPDQPVGELWLGFLRYYLFEFDHDAYVVTIRQKKLLIRFVKMWKSLFAIEDPFNLNHNLTSGLSHSMLLYLLNVFHTVLVHHTTFLRKQMSMGEWCYSLFSPEYIVVDRTTPKDTRCFVCHQLGHWAAQCRKNKKATNVENKDEMSIVDSLIGHFLDRNSTSTSESSEKPLMSDSGDSHHNSHRPRHINSNITSSPGILSANTPRQGRPVFMSSNNYGNVYKPQNNYSSPSVHNNYQHREQRPTYTYEQSSNPVNYNSMNAIYPPQPPVNLTPGLLGNGSKMVYPMQHNRYYQQQQRPYQHPTHQYPPPLTYVPYNSYTSQGNHRMNYLPHEQQISNANNANWILNPIVCQPQILLASTDNAIETPVNNDNSKRSPYKPKQMNVTTTHQTENTSHTPNNHESNSQSSKQPGHHGVTNYTMHKNASSSSGSEEKFTSSTKRSRNQQNRQFTFSSSSNGKQNSQRLSNNMYNAEIEPSKKPLNNNNKSVYPNETQFTRNNHSWNSYKPNPSPKKNYDSQRSYYSRATGSSRPYDHDVDASLSERLHNMNATHPSN